MPRRKFGVFLASVLAAAFILGAALAQAADLPNVKWRMTTSWPTGIPLYTDMAELFAKTVGDLTGGKFKIQVLPGGAVAPALEVTDAVQKGIVEMGHLWPGYDIGKDPTSAIMGGYAGDMESAAALHWLYVGGGDQLWREWRLAKFGIIGMACGMRPTEVFLHSHKAIKTLADFQGAKIRTVGAWAEILPKLGAAVVSLPGNEVFPALERKVIDGTEWATPGENVISGFHEVAKYIIVPGSHQPSAPFELEINKAKWDGLPKEYQAVINYAAAYTTFMSWAKIGGLDMTAMETFKKKGNEIIYLDSETQTKIHQLGKEWAAEKAKDNEWFKKVFESKNAFEKSWDGVSSTRYFSLKR
ncbi:MAG: TRAP transporter substrate-binding protein DctP [Thermodesulfobacteriota bacterium]